MARRNSHCSYCGHAFAAEQPWPRTCAGCTSVSYQNPLPVAVVLLPVDDGVLAIRRGIEPKKGGLALPGGFIELGESWQHAAARELFEETGIRTDENAVRDLCALSAPEGMLLVFGVAPRVRSADLPAFSETNETTERVVLKEFVELAFPLHTEALRRYFASTR